MKVTNFPPLAAIAAGVFASLAISMPTPARPQAPGDRSEVMVLDDVTIIDVENGRAIPHQSVRIAGERIEHIDDAAKAEIPEGAKIIPGKGPYLAPGFFDAHVHMSIRPETFGPLLLANGVTAVRDTGAPTDAIIQLRGESQQRGASMPQIICTGAIVDGDPPVWPFSEPCDTPDEARAAVRKLKEAGVDQIKVYSLLKPDVYRAAIVEAHSQGLKAVGHVPNTVSLDEALDAGQDCFEHLMGFERLLVELSGKPADDRQGVWTGLSGWLRYPDIDKAQLHERLKAVAEKGTMQCPTIVVMAGIGAAADPAKANADERMAFVPVHVRAIWGQDHYREFGRWTQQMVPHMVSMLGDLHRAGVPLMIGTDLANPYVFAGSGVHDEMKVFAQAGIPTADILRSATIIPARFCDVDDDLGSVAQGKLASLVLLRSNPFDNIANASKVQAVVVRGAYHDRATLDKMLAAVREYVASTTPAQAEGVDMNLPGELVVRGRYGMKFNGQFDAGMEDFVITRDKAGFHLRVHSQPQGGFQSPAVVDYHVDPNFKFVNAEWKQLTAKPTHATYALKDGTLTATAKEGDAALPPQEFAVPDRALITAPVSACDFALYRGLGLKVDETRECQAVGFGYPGWQVAAVPMTITRKADDEAFVLPDGTKITARRFATKTTVEGMGDMLGDVWTDEDGVMLRSVLKAQFGSIETTLIEQKRLK